MSEGEEGAWDTDRFPRCDGPSEEDAMKHMPKFLDLPVDRVMTRRPDTVGPEDALGDAAGLMVSGG